MNMNNEELLEQGVPTVRDADEVNLQDVNEGYAAVGLLEMMQNPKQDFFCSIPDDGKMETRKVMYNSLASPDHNVEEIIGKQIELVDVVAYPVTFLSDGDNGVEVNCLRCILIDKNGKSYAAVSQGIANSLMRLFTIFGMPHWTNPIKVEVKQVKTRNGNNKVNILTVV